MLNEGKHVFTSESVTEGHPDKVCDQISDSILDAILMQDPNARVACETMITQGQVIISGEITTIADIEYETINGENINETKSEKSISSLHVNNDIELLAISGVVLPWYKIIYILFSILYINMGLTESSLSTILKPFDCLAHCKCTANHLAVSARVVMKGVCAVLIRTNMMKK